MRSTLTVLFTIFFYAIGQCQNKTIVIDTLMSKDNNLTLDNLASSCDTSTYSLFKENDIEIKIQYNKYPNAIITWVENTCINLLLDNKGGICSISGINSDTIYIDKWTVYKNGLDDILNGSVEYYQKLNDSINPVPLSKKKILDRVENTGVRNLNKVKVTVNQHTYRALVEIDSIDVQENFHGYIPLEAQEEYLSDNREKDKIYKYKYFYGIRVRTIQTYNAFIQL